MSRRPRPVPADEAHGERGSITVFVAVVVLALFAAIGLVVDGGGRVHALQRARLTAAEAARTAGQQLDGPRLVTGDRPRPDTARAARAARSYLAAAGVSGTVDVASEGIHVRTQVTYEPVFLSIIGFGPMHLQGEATARPVDSATVEAP